MIVEILSKGFGRKRSWPISRYYLRIWLEELRKVPKSSIEKIGLWDEIVA
jgi:hypothetical protein